MVRYFSLTEPPEPLTRRERQFVWLATIAFAATRFLAVALTPWDWDEALFGLALRDFDVTQFHPHPPGFPLFILFAKALQLVGLGEFRALQTVSVAASLFVFPAMFFLVRELRGSVHVAIVSAALLTFFPNVWLYGGMALSDIPSMVLVMLACALLLRGCRSNPALYAGAIVLAIAAGMRPQNLVIGFAPAMLALFHQRWRIVVPALLGAAILAASYGGAAHFSGGWDGYRDAVTRHQQYIAGVDSFRAPLRPSLLYVADDFFVRPFRNLPINAVLALLVLAGLATRAKHVVLALLAFAPFCLFAWLVLDFHSASRFSLGYAPLMALLAGSARVPRVVPGAIVIAMAFWTMPALRVVRTTPSPPAAAIATIPPEALVFIDERLGAHIAFLAPHVKLSPERAGAWELREGETVIPGARAFKRDRQPLARIARDRYFEVSLIPPRTP
ncbi:MAG TPA: glycosyltransferase family 39 protein [Thermoanaerobaculia bacterium]